MLGPIGTAAMLPSANAGLTQFDPRRPERGTSGRFVEGWGWKEKVMGGNGAPGDCAKPALQVPDPPRDLSPSLPGTPPHLPHLPAARPHLRRLARRRLMGKVNGSRHHRGSTLRPSAVQSKRCRGTRKRPVSGNSCWPGGIDGIRYMGYVFCLVV